MLKKNGIYLACLYWTFYAREKLMVNGKQDAKSVYYNRKMFF